MGNICADNIVKHKPNRLSRQIVNPTKYFQQGSSLKIQIQTWIGQPLPDLRNDINVEKNSLTINNEGQFVFDELSHKTAFNIKSQEHSTSNESKDTQQQKCNKHNSLTVNIQKTLKGYELNYQNDFIYELIKTPMMIEQGSKFLLGGTQYKLVKYIDDNSYGARKIRTITQFQDDRAVQTQQYIKSFSHLTDSQSCTPVCRICMNQQNSKQNPLICPCNCTGSVKYYHMSCYTSWAFSTQKTSENVYVGNVKRQKCQICKKSLLNDSVYRQTIAALISSVHKIKAPFIVLQGLKPLKDFPYYRKVELTYVILSFAQKKRYVIGRSNTADVKLQIDNSISRINSLITMKNGKIYLQDSDSKHGTYIKATQNIKIVDNVERTFLYKNNLINVKIE